MMAPVTRGIPELRVPRRRVAVDLALAGRAAQRLELAVEPRERPTGRADWADVREVIEGDRTFLPLHEVGSDRWFLVNRDRIVWLAVPTDVAGAEPGEPDVLYDQRARVEIELEGGARLLGELLFAAPSDQARTGDHLNAEGRFLTVFQPDRVLLVSKAAVHVLVETSPETP